MIENIRKDVPSNTKRIVAIGGGTIIDISKFLILDYEGTIDQVIMQEIPYKTRNYMSFLLHVERVAKLPMLRFLS